MKSHLIIGIMKKLKIKNFGVFLKIILKNSTKDLRKRDYLINLRL